MKNLSKSINTNNTSNSPQTIIVMDTTNNINDTMPSGDDTSTSEVITSLKSNSINVDYLLDISLDEISRNFFKKMLKLNILFETERIQVGWR